MSRRRQNKGGFIRNKPLTEGEPEYRVVSVDQETKSITLIGIFSSWETAQHIAKSYKQDGKDIYLHGESNRVLAKV